MGQNILDSKGFARGGWRVGAAHKVVVMVFVGAVQEVFASVVEEVFATEIFAVIYRGNICKFTRGNRTNSSNMNCVINFFPSLLFFLIIIRKWCSSVKHSTHMSRHYK